MGAYESGRNLGEWMASERAEGRYDYDCRWDLADAAKQPGDYFNEFKRGLDDGLSSKATT